MGWVFGSVALAFCGLVVLAYCAFRVAVAARGLAVALDRARSRLEPRGERLRERLDMLHREQ